MKEVRCYRCGHVMLRLRAAPLFVEENVATNFKKIDTDACVKLGMDLNVCSNCGIVEHSVSDVETVREYVAAHVQDS
jgi:hypothetical protein